MDLRKLPKIEENSELNQLKEEIAKLKLATYDLMMAIQRIEVNQQKLLFKKEIK